jgi:hypothetical protein
VLSERVEQVRQLRSESNRPSTQKLAKTPWLFGELRQPTGDYIAIPRITSENRDYVPMDILSADTVVNDKCSSISGDNLRYFSVLQSSIFNIWNNAISGRTGMSTLISNTVTYNNFPFPEFALEVTESLEACAREILDSRKQYPESSLADLYDPKSMPVSLQKAHAQNDLAVKSAYGIKNRLNDDQVLQHIFNLYVDLSKNLR